MPPFYFGIHPLSRKNLNPAISNKAALLVAPMLV